MSKQTIGNTLLLALEKSVDGYIRLEDFLYNTHIYAKGYDRPLKKSSLSKAIERLRTKGFIDAKKYERNLTIKINELGRQFIITKAKQEADWDGLWRIVVFDIPEEHKKIRSQIRWYLKQWEFKQLQKSVWVSKVDIVLELEEFVRDAKIANWVKVFEAKEIKF